MSKTAVFTLPAVALIGIFFVFCGYNEKPAPTNISDQTPENISHQTDDKNALQNQMDDKNAHPNRKVTITKAEIRSGKDAGVYITLSDGKTRMIAETVEFKHYNFSEVKTFREVFISPNKQFLAIDANGFEESFVQIYDAADDTLHKRTYGKVSAWTDDNLLKVESCNLAGENCSDKISIGGDTPWVFRQGDEGVVLDEAKLLPKEDFISNINKVKKLSIFSKLLKAAVAADAIKGTGPFTIFAPTNEAFEKLPKGAVADLLQPGNKQQLVRLIRRHVVAGQYNTAQVESEIRLKTIGNDALTLSSNESGTVKINSDSIISQPNVYSSNGIVHIITEVLS